MKLLGEATYGDVVWRVLRRNLLLEESCESGVTNFTNIFNMVSEAVVRHLESLVVEGGVEYGRENSRNRSGDEAAQPAR